MTNKIKRIYHTADWHLYSNKRHEEFIEAIELFTQSILKEQSKLNLEYKEQLIVISGDLFHDYNIPSNEANLIMINTLDSLAKICRVVIIIGNHDLNHTNLSQLDTITPIITAMNNPNIFFYKESKCYVMDNIVFCVYAFLEKNIRPYRIIYNNESIRIHTYNNLSPKEMLKCNFSDDIKNHQQNYKKPEYKYLALYHDPIVGISESSINLDSGIHDGRDVSLKIFNDTDGGLLGDIHKHQCIMYGNTPLVYPSSLTQPTYSESATKRGYISWDVNTLNWKFHKLDYTYMRCQFKVSSFEDIDNNKEILTNR